MRKVTICIVIFCITMQSPIISAVSVHSVESVDFFPQGDFANDQDWDLADKMAFSESPSDYTSVMISDQHLSFTHDRPENSEEQSLWATFTSTDSNASMGVPDGAYTWSTGPMISLSGFDTSGVDQYQLLSASLVIAFSIPDALVQDSVRFSIESGSDFEIIREWSHTQSSTNYFNQPYWTTNLFEHGISSWTAIQGMEVDLDYVGKDAGSGLPDDSQLQVDAVGVKVSFLTPWFGTERAEAISSVNSLDLPFLELNLSSGTMVELALTACGLEAEEGSTNPQWISEVIERPESQDMGRWHWLTSDDSNSIASTNVRTSEDNQTWDEWVEILASDILPNKAYVQIKIMDLDFCLERVWVDFNDPTLSITGSFSGSLDGLDQDYSRWIVQVNDITIFNEYITNTGGFSIQSSIGHAFTSEELEISIKAWFSWNSSGNASSLVMQVQDISISGGFHIEWDYDPHCNTVEDIEIDEDGGGILVPFFNGCHDDRSPKEALEIDFSNYDQNLIQVTLDDSSIKVIPQAEMSGTTNFDISVIDEAGNSWTQEVDVVVKEINDPPVIERLPGIQFAEIGVSKSITLNVEDPDTSLSSLEITTNKSWADIDNTGTLLTILPPIAGFNSILVEVCDEASCDSIVIELEIRALPDLVVEDIFAKPENPQPGDILEIQVNVRNTGQNLASLSSIRCLIDNRIADIASVPSLDPGSLGSVTCTSEILEGDNVLRITAIVDSGQEIVESDEDNNEKSLLIEVTNPNNVNANNEDVSSINIPPGIAYGSSIIGVIFIIGLFVLFGPSKIKRLD